MSLINDALRRTQQAETQRPLPRNNLALKPLELQPDAPAGDDVVSRAKWTWLIIVLAVVCLNGGLFLWYAQQRAVEARAQAEAVAEAERTAAAAAEAERQRLAAEEAERAAAALAATQEAQAATPKVERPEFRLQSIVSHPTRPSAMVNNRVVFVGDRVAGYEVTRITPEAVTLVSGEDEAVISLP
jgi:hypothetical protein